MARFLFEVLGLVQAANMCPDQPRVVKKTLGCRGLKHFIFDFLFVYKPVSDTP